jgi:hypothetical protein
MVGTVRGSGDGGVTVVAVTVAVVAVAAQEVLKE